MATEGTLITNGDSAVTIPVKQGRRYVFSCELVTGTETLTLSRILNATAATIQAFTASEEGVVVRAPTDELQVSISNGGAGTYRYHLAQIDE